jgi:peptidoglycan lytic transglycosylase
MVKRQKPRYTNLKTPRGICLLAGIFSLAVAAVVLFLSTRIVHADAPLPRLASAASPVAGGTPSSLAKPTQAARQWKGKLHGLASWYGAVFDGRPTASGERYNMFALTACHPTLPFGSVVRVINRRNKRSVVVRITDRGDLPGEGRIIDLSFAAAEELAIIHSGLAQVDIEVLSLGHNH